MRKSISKRLLEKFKNGICSDDEIEQIEAYYTAIEDVDKKIPTPIEKNWELFSDLELKLLKSKIYKHKTNAKKYTYYTRIAAIILLLFGIGIQCRLIKHPST